ncbi:hypothetical protein [[Clostridium] scindens]|uniref:hypothetical protein n=1 Tax=Clostridium scindens (strain JCM 10418 / VPI 12708) TaxID=29347 RepID=UPI00156E27B9|nr:hypothetical protein [[Clostridium] scindens]NSI88096.1 hypothetical protein [[Clostridium] scindens]NSJ02720.1 hypothetical protein [[Clostridium] scindens]
MSRVLPILFNTDMVRAILDERKTVTRRCVKHNVEAILHSPYHAEHRETPDKVLIEKLCQPPYQPGDILYVRETWCKNYYHNYGKYFYRADGEEIDMPLITGGTIKYGKADGLRWRPYIHMPKEAARIWLKVTDVRVERLQDITDDQAKKEGICEEWAMAWWKPTYNDPDSGGYPCYRDTFANDLWDSVVKTPDLDRYGWDANPWVWVIEFERCEKPEK